ncbi:MAG: hypothetical protein ACK2UK_07185 [Candidatus Promineifilaceae bacterium]
MTRKWYLLLLLLLPFIPVALWGSNLSEGAYASLRVAHEAMNETGLLPFGIVDFQPLSTPLFPLAIAFGAQFGAEASRVALFLGTLGWGVAALLIWWGGRRLGTDYGGLAAAILYGFNPWIVNTLGEATGWIIALVWLLANFALRRRFLVAGVGTLFLLSLFFHPSQGFSWPLDLISPLAWSIFLLACGWAAERLSERLVARGADRLSPSGVTAVLLGLFMLTAGSWQAARLWQAYNTRPLGRWALEEEVASYLQLHSDPEAGVLSSERLAYLSDRQRVAAGADTLEMLVPEDAPDYVVASSTLPWDLLRDQIWFRLYYEPLQTFGAAHGALDQMQLWGYRPPPKELGLLELLNARVPDRLSILGYQLSPQPAEPGSQTTLTLYLQRPEATLVEPGQFKAIVRLVAPGSGEIVREWTKDLPQSVAPEAWKPGQVIIEQIQFPIQAGMAPGAYRLDLSLVGEGEAELWPFSVNNDINRLDRVPLGYVAVPGPATEQGAVPVQATFEQGIHLESMTTGGLSRGNLLPITLYWTADQPVTSDNMVFVHLVDENGALIANHDGVPAAGRFPTDSWLPGMVIADDHALAIPHDLAAGRYELRAGLYDPASGARLGVLALNSEPASGDFVTVGSLVLEP